MESLNRLLLVEDDPNAGMLIHEYLEAEGFHVSLCINGSSAIETFRTNKFDLCILDCMLPDKDGFTLAKLFKASNPLVPLIFLTAKSMQDDKIRGFRLGADDYITKPFEPQELLFRIKAVLRRTQNNGAVSHDQFVIGGYTFDYKNQSLTYDAEVRRITKKESEVLKELCINKNQLLKKNELLLSIWGESDYFTGRSLDVFIAKLRKYLSLDSKVEIENVHSVGFILKDNI